MLAVVERSAGISREKPPQLVRGMSARHPWAWGNLVFAVPFDQQNPEGLRDVVNGIAPTASTGVTWQKDDRGNPVAELLDTTDSSIQYARLPPYVKPTTGLTVWVRLRRISPGDTSGGVVTHVYGPSAPFTSWAITAEVQGNQPRLAGSVTDGDLTVVSTPNTATYPDDKFWNVFLFWRGNAVKLNIYHDRGSLFSQADSGGTASSIAYADDQEIRINATESLTTNFAAQYSQVLIWSRGLREEEMQALSGDPYGWCSPRRETMVLGAPFPVLLGSAWRVFGYAMFPTAGERDAMQAKVQEWVAAHTADQVWASGHTIHIDDVSTPYALPAGQATPSLNDSDGGGPWPGLTWSYQVSSQGLRDDFGAVTSVTEAQAALDGSQWGEATT